MDMNGDQAAKRAWQALANARWRRVLRVTRQGVRMQALDPRHVCFRQCCVPISACDTGSPCRSSRRVTRRQWIKRLTVHTRPTVFAGAITRLDSTDLLPAVGQSALPCAHRTTYVPTRHCPIAKWPDTYHGSNKTRSNSSNLWLVSCLPLIPRYRASFSCCCCCRW